MVLSTLMSNDVAICSECKLAIGISLFQHSISGLIIYLARPYLPELRSRLAPVKKEVFSQAYVFE